MLTSDEKNRLLLDEIIPRFKPLLNSNIYSVIFDFNYKVIICTNLSAKSVGLNSWEDLVGFSFNDHDDAILAKQIFGEQYTEKSSDYIHQYARMIFEVQQLVMKDGKIACFLDLLPYNGILKSYIVTYIPIIDKCGEVIAIQSFATEAKFFSQQDYLNQILFAEDVNAVNAENISNLPELTAREREIVFLLANGFTQDQIAPVLKISRSTIASIVANQLSPKFGLFGSNTKLLAQKAIQHNLHKAVPSSLYRPYIVMLDQ